MGIPLRVQLTLDSSNLGCLTRLLEDGTINRMTIVGPEDQADPRNFAKTLRGEDNDAPKRRQRVEGIRAVECTITIMQRKPHSPWLQSQIGETLAKEFDYNSSSVSPAVALLVNHGYIIRNHNGFIELTDKGRAHPQSEPLPFVTSHREEMGA